MGRTKAVFGGAQNAVGQVAITFKLQYSIHHVLEDFGTSNGAVLGDMTDEENGRSRLLGKFHQLSRTLAYLRYRTCRRLDVLTAQGLDGVNDQKIRLKHFYLLKNLLRIRLRQYVAIGVFGRHAVGPHFYLCLTFLPRHVEYFFALQHQGDLQHQRRLSYAGFAPYQDQRACHDASTKDAIQFRIARNPA